MNDFFQQDIDVEFDEIQAIVTASGLGLSASELHGYQTGLVSMQLPFGETQWWAQLQIDYPSGQSENIASADRQLLFNLVERVEKSLASDSFEFDLMLPDDDASLILRVTSLCEWCSGYLSGLQTALTLVAPIIRIYFEKSDQIKELLVDLSAIRQADQLQISEVDDLLETERNYAEITEYVRVAVMNVYMDIALEILKAGEAELKATGAKPKVH